MAKVTIGFGVLLALIGLGGLVFWGAGAHPIAFGLLLIACGVLANTENPRKRMIWMHVAVTIGLLGFLVPGTMSTVLMVKAHKAGMGLAQPGKIHEQVLVALVCLVYVVLCVRSFIAARRLRAV